MKRSLLRGFWCQIATAAALLIVWNGEAAADEVAPEAMSRDAVAADSDATAASSTLTSGFVVRLSADNLLTAKFRAPDSENRSDSPGRNGPCEGHPTRAASLRRPMIRLTASFN